MKILSLYKFGCQENFGGVEYIISQLGESCPNPHHFLELACGSENKEEKITNTYARIIKKTNFTALSTAFSISFAIALFRQVRGVDVILVHHPYPFAQILTFLLRKSSCSLACFYHADITQGLFSTPYKWLTERFLERCEWIFVTNSTYPESSRILSRHKSRIKVLMPHPPLEEGESSPAAADLPVAIPSKFALFLGALRPYKAVGDLIEALEGTEVKLVIAGDGVEAARLKTLAYSNPNVLFVGAVSETQKKLLLKTCEMLILPSKSRKESLGIVLLEAACYGRPLITRSIANGSREINLNGHTGFALQDHSISALREAIVSLWNNPSLAAEMGRHAKKHVSYLHSQRGICAEMIRLLETGSD